MAKQIKKTIKSRRTQEQRREASDEQLLRAAVELIARRGSRISLAEVGRSSGFSHAFAGARFGSRAEFIRFVTLKVREHSHKAWVAHAEARQPIEAFEAYLEWIARSNDEGRALYVLLTEALTLESPQRDEFAEHNFLLRQAFQEILERSTTGKNLPPGVSIEAITIALVGMLRGIAMQWLLEGDAIDMKKARMSARWMLERAFEGILTAEGSATDRNRSRAKTTP